MLSEKQEFIIKSNGIIAVKGSGYWYFRIRGNTPRQKTSLSREGALKKAIGYLKSNIN